MCEKASKGTFIKPEKQRKGKEKRKREERERRRRKKSNGFLVFIRVTLEMAHFDRLAEFFGNN